MDSRVQFCPWCGKANAHDAVICSSCGTPLGHDESGDHHRHADSRPRPLWRRPVLMTTLALLVVIVAGVVVAVLQFRGDGGATTTVAGADATAGPTTTDTEPTTTDTTALDIPLPPVEAAFGQSLEVWHTTMTVSPPEILKDETVQEYVGDAVDVYVVSVTIANTSSDTRDYNLFYWQAADQDGTIYDPSLYIENQALDSGDIEPGKSVKGYVGFELPKGKSISWISYSPMMAGETVTWKR
jgi:hypothetical protein